MSWQDDVLFVRAQLTNAKKRFLQLQGAEDRLIVANAPCSLCQQAGGGRGDVGTPCRKNGFGAFTRSHAERRRAAAALIAGEGSKKMPK